MMTRAYLGAYWGARRESVEECSERLSKCLSGMAAVHPALAQWFPQRNTSRIPSGAKPLDTSPAALKPVLLRGRNRTDSEPRQVIEQLGFGASRWNGHAELPMSFGLTCGGWSERVGNHFVLTLSSSVDVCSWLDVDAMVELVSIVAASWEPDWSTVCTPEMRAVQPGRTPIVGAVTYGRALRKRGLRRLPAPTTMRQVRGLPGNLVVASSQCGDITPALVQRIARALTSIGHS